MVAKTPKSGGFQIEVLKGLDAIRKRPEMYIGDRGRLGVARLIGASVEVLATLTVNRDGSPMFRHHALLHVTLEGRGATGVIDHHPDEAPDIALRTADMALHRDQMRPDRWALCVESPNAVAPLPVVRALSVAFHLVRQTGGNTVTVLNDPEGPPPSLQTSEKGALAAIRLELSECVDPAAMTRDFLEGFLQGHFVAPGLVLGSCRVS